MTWRDDEQARRIAEHVKAITTTPEYIALKARIASAQSPSNGSPSADQQLHQDQRTIR